MNKQLFYRPVQAHQQLFRRHRTCVVGTAARGRNCRFSKPCATRCRRKSSPRPTTIRSAAIRKPCATICARATRLLKEAGFEVRDRKLVDAAGKPVTRRNPGAGSVRRADRAVLQAVAGAASASPTSIRIVDDAQYQNRLRSFDFDIIIDRVGRSRCRPATSSANSGARRRPISPARATLIGIKNPAVDALIDTVIFAKDRADLVAATKALDRVLLWNFYVVPQFTYRLLALCALGSLQPSPSRCRNTAVPGFPTLWWYDAEKAARIGKRS